MYMVREWMYLGHSLKLGTKMWYGNQTWIPSKWYKQTFQTISEFMFLWRVACYSYVRVEKEIKSPFDLDLMHIEQYHSCNMKSSHIKNIIWICATMPNKILMIAVKETKSSHSRKELGEKMNKGLAKCLVLICKITHLHFSTKLCEHIFDTFCGID